MGQLLIQTDPTVVIQRSEISSEQLYTHFDFKTGFYEAIKNISCSKDNKCSVRNEDFYNHNFIN